MAAQNMMQWGATELVVTHSCILNRFIFREKTHEKNSYMPWHCWYCSQSASLKQQPTRHRHKRAEGCMFPTASYAMEPAEKVMVPSQR
jgi:hypothetical protein